MNIASPSDQFVVELAKTAADLGQIQQLRYDVFVMEFGADEGGIDHETRRETDQYDTAADHLVLRDKSRSEGADIVGVYRLLRQSQLNLNGQFYSASEYDLEPLLQSGTRLLELSRTCLHPDYRGGTGLLHLWKGLTAYVADYDIDLIFGVASFRGSNPRAFHAPLALLHQNYLAPAHLRPTAIGKAALAAIDFAETPFDHRDAMIAMPSLIKAYLRMGGVVGEGAYVDNAFGTTDVCMILETNKLTAVQRSFLGAASDV